MESHDDEGSAKGCSRGLNALVPTLAAEFPGYFIGTQPTWNGVSLFAQDKERAAWSGMYAVITVDPDEMRRALREQHRPGPGRQGEKRPS